MVALNTTGDPVAVLPPPTEKPSEEGSAIATCTHRVMDFAAKDRRIPLSVMVSVEV